MRNIKREVKSITPGKLYGHTQVKLGAEGVVYSPNQSFRWEAGENTSSCPSPAASHDHDPSSCSHGIRASFVRGEAPVFSQLSMTAVVEGYGEVVTNKKGFRAQRGRLVALALNEPVSRIQPPGKGALVLLSLLTLLGIAMLAWASHVLTVSPVFSWENAVTSILIAAVSVAVIYIAFFKGLLPVAREYDYERSLTKRAGADEIAFDQQVVEDFEKRYPDVEVFGSVGELLEVYGDKLKTTELIPA